MAHERLPHCQPQGTTIEFVCGDLNHTAKARESYRAGVTCIRDFAHCAVIIQTAMVILGAPGITHFCRREHIYDAQKKEGNQEKENRPHGETEASAQAERA